MTTNKDKTAVPDNPTTNLILNYILLFFLCAFLGWIWEVILTIIQHGMLVNRGVLHGPWLPIYGFGGLGIAVLLRRFHKHPGVVFVSNPHASGIKGNLNGW